MPGPSQLTAVLLLALLGTGCVGTAQIEFDEREDLSTYQTWDWLVRTKLDVTPGVPAATKAKLIRLIDQRLLDNGFRRSGAAEPDFYMTFQLAMRRRPVEVSEPSAIYQLSSFHSSPSYLIEGNRIVTHQYSEMRLAIAAIRPGAGTVWQATFSQFERAYQAMKLEEAVAMLLARFPRQHSKAPEERLFVESALAHRASSHSGAVSGLPGSEFWEVPTGSRVESAGERRSGNSAPAH